MSRTTRPALAGRFFVVAMLVVAASAGAAPADSFLPVYRGGAGVLETDLAIGDEDEDEYILYGPWDIAVDDGGNIFVLDHKVHVLKKFDRDGNHVRTFSHEGEGPGELGTSMLGLALTPDGHPLIVDYMNNRFTEFDNDGEYAGDRKAFGRFIPDMALAPDGSAYLEFSDSDMEDFNYSRLSVARYTRDFDLVAVVDSMRTVTQRTSVHEGGMRAIGLPYTDGFAWAATPDGGLVIARRGEYRIRVLSPSLELVREITRDVEPAKVTKANRVDYVEDMHESYRDIAREVELPDRKPYIASLLVDHEGNILVCRHDEEDTYTHYDAYTSQGEFIGEVELPSVRKFKVIKGGYVYGVETFEEELPQVHRYRLVPAEKAKEREDT